MPPRTIVIIGGLAMDLVTVTDRLPEMGETLNAHSFTKHLGGKGANSAVTAYRASHLKPNNDNALPDISAEYKDEIEVRMIGAVGDDEFGPPCIAKLEQTGVDVSGIRTVEGQPTGVCVIIVESDFGENRILLTAGANLSLLPGDFLTLESLAGGIKPDLLIAQLEIPRETVEQILKTASLAGIDVLLNPAPAQYLLSSVYPTITHLVVNESEAALLSGRYMDEIVSPEGWASVTDEFLEKGVKNVVITLGAKGAYYSSAIGQGGHVEAEKNLNVVDTTGAGDTFVGTYGVEFVKQKQMGKWDIRQAVQRACKASARTICVLGAQEAIPWADEIDPVSVEDLPVESLSIEPLLSSVPEHVEGIEP